MEETKKLIYSEEMALHTGEETDWTTATTGSPYSPKKDGRLIQLKLYFGQTTARICERLHIPVSVCRYSSFSEVTMPSLGS